MSLLRPIAIHLPQFHPFQENDLWWGKGFTEWTNVTKASPKFKGHYQPHLPTDLGFYDLRLPESRESQAELAKEYGIYGFCYYHYWFNGKRVMERPVQDILNSNKPNFPFCLCWANENWTRNWDGKDKEVLLKQDYNHEDDLNHIRYLIQYFKDDRYIRVDGKPLFVIYKTEQFPNIKRTVDIWRSECLKAGVGEIYLARMEASAIGIDPLSIDFDAAIEFQPRWRMLNENLRMYGSLSDRLKHKLGYEESPFINNRIFSYEEFVEDVISKEKVDYKLFPGITPMWDNSARRNQGATILEGSTPDLYGKWLDHIVKNFQPYSSEENFVFINAWNEWAEGNHLEPCRKWGRAYLEKTQKVFLSSSRVSKKLSFDS
ncbi:glycoside hydrolase family 99-like domain-containing protein [Sediminitomix flava]|uniref:Glycosyl transferase family WbsX n=1 Tax=Sediminitomix flava TaxID=379075 RepID=A0A315ZCJ3_SEDFL|nr:glycoside hydrolase family 99-like domain-containing protein [Sediminitomix flava]PWJ43305.1 glycosyl transferase family WbsX [Sediminitomix flava]